jgi:4-azaleucine resistance transporter AzlC
MNKYFLNGIKESYPIVLGYIPIGLAFGVLARSTGISPLGVLLISLIMFAGSAQFITVSMLASLASGVSIVFTIFIVNFRHFLMSSAYSKYFKNNRLSSLAFLSFFITDESFAIGINKAKYDNEEFNKSYLLGVELSGYFTWAIFTTIGAIVGSFITDFDALGLDFALPAMFIGLLALLIKTKKDLIVCILAGVLTLLLSMTSLESFAVIIGSIIASLVLIGGQDDKLHE